MHSVLYRYYFYSQTALKMVKGVTCIDRLSTMYGKSFCIG